MTDSVDDAVARIRAWGEAREWRGYDPYDALNSPAAPFLTLGTRLGRRLLTQAVKLSPVNLRPVLGIRPNWNAKALGLVASGYARLWVAGHRESDRRQAERWLEWLAANHSGDESGLAWGYHFDVQTRFFAYSRGTPNAIATSFVAQAFLDGYEVLGDERWGEHALAAARYLESRLLIGGEGGSYFRYLPREDELVHNANLLACAVLARTAHLLGEQSLAEPARLALETSLAAQRGDGSWPYAAGRSGDWVDNFHTGYVLESLARCATLNTRVPDVLERGVDYWDRALFLSDGTPKYASEQLYPIDAHGYATAIDTWLAVGRPEKARRTAELLIDTMFDPAGYVWFQRRRLWTNKVPFIRWTTAPSFRALAGVLVSELE